MKYKKINSAFILGSTSEIAKAICIELAKQGCKKFVLIARNKSKNNIFAQELIEKFNVEVTTKELDLLQIEKKYDQFVINNCDLYLLATGYLGSYKKNIIDKNEAINIYTANYTGVILMILKIISCLENNSQKKIWVLSSVASDKGRPSNYQYGAAKAALNTFCEGLFYLNMNKKLSIRVIKAGFVGTTKTLKIAPRFLCISPQKFARKLLENTEKKGIEYLPRWWYMIMKFVKILPDAFISKL